MQTAKNIYFPHILWELCTVYSKGRGEGGLNSKIRPCVEGLFLAYLLASTHYIKIEIHDKGFDLHLASEIRTQWSG